MMDDDKAMTTLTNLLNDGSLRYRAPPYLRARVEARLPRKSLHLSWLAWRMRAIDPALALAGGGLAGVAVSAMVFAMLSLVPPQQTSRMGQELVTSHVRALLSQHAMDVLSTDQHTVKPWFNGRLNYAPPVIRLPAGDFPLAGGRVDYVDHRMVAVLIYRYQQHPIDLYVFPAASGVSTPVTDSSDGYSIVHWHQKGMDFWAVSDAEPVHVNAFVQAIRTELGN
ncbi:transcriptional regulator [Ralstonia solanacearum]|nr:transcriptional regulator [Ralstonia solanacearum]AXV92543.1 transcriptional regulator [Ralstonia solanacearum]AXW20601.1 transcriptional regulator [Ralstonia solanacearum]AXW77435.1 transcriptional regulator [Ralstonia solanacearum]